MVSIATDRGVLGVAGKPFATHQPGGTQSDHSHGSRDVRGGNETARARPFLVFPIERPACPISRDCTFFVFAKTATLAQKSRGWSQKSWMERTQKQTSGGRKEDDQLPLGSVSQLSRVFSFRESPYHFPETHNGLHVGLKVKHGLGEVPSKKVVSRIHR